MAPLVGSHLGSSTRYSADTPSPNSGPHLRPAGSPTVWVLPGYVTQADDLVFPSRKKINVTQGCPRGSVK